MDFGFQHLQRRHGPFPGQICLYGPGAIGYMQIHLRAEESDLSTASLQLQEDQDGPDRVAQDSSEIADATDQVQKLQTDIARAQSEGSSS